MTDENVFAMKPSASVVAITPEMAARWLAKNLRNRNVRAAVVDSYARDMAAGEWQLTGEAVKFDRRGDLIDGQHRLHAVARSGVTVPMFVVRGLATEAQDFMDTGAKRGAGDMLHLHGHKNAPTVAAIARLALYLNAGIEYRNKRWTNSEIAQWVTDNPDVAYAATAAHTARSVLDLPPSVIGITWLQFNRVDPEACEIFWSSLVNNATNGSGDPRNTLLRRVASARKSGEYLSQPVLVGFVVRAWNAWRKGTALHVLKSKSGANTGGVVSVAIPKAV